MLERLYVKEHMTSRDIAKKLGVGDRTVVRRLHQFGIPVRNTGPKRHKRLRSKEWLKRQYEELGKSTVVIGTEIGASPKVVGDWLKHHGIDVRPRGGALKGKKMSKAGRRKISVALRGKRKGQDNPNWKGGYKDPTFSERRNYKAKKWRDAVKERDGYQCVHCGETEGRLHAHHVKSWKSHPELRYEVSNGMTLCPPCHEKEHGFSFKWYKARHEEMGKSAEHSKE